MPGGSAAAGLSHSSPTASGRAPGSTVIASTTTKSIHDSADASPARAVAERQVVDLLHDHLARAVRAAAGHRVHLVEHLEAVDERDDEDEEGRRATAAGSVTLNSRRHQPAPSTFAASYISGEIACSPASRITMTKPRSFHADARMIEGIAQAGSVHQPGPSMPKKREHRVDDAVARVEQPAPDECDDDPARHDRAGSRRRAGTTRPLSARVEGEGEREAADVDERQVADDVVQRCAGRSSPVSRVGEQARVVVESDELHGRDEVPLVEADPGGARPSGRARTARAASRSAAGRRARRARTAVAP